MKFEIFIEKKTYLTLRKYQKLCNQKKTGNYCMAQE